MKLILLLFVLVGCSEPNVAGNQDEVRDFQLESMRERLAGCHMRAEYCERIRYEEPARCIQDKKLAGCQEAIDAAKSLNVHAPESFWNLCKKYEAK